MDERFKETQTPVRANDTLANERTFLAYVRTSLAFIAFGFVIARFSLFTREFSALVHQVTPESSLSIWFGTTVAIVGIAVAIFGAWRYAVTDRELRHGVVSTLSRPMGYLISILVAVIGLIVAYEVLSYR